MNALTQIELLDHCIDGDKERLHTLLGNMYDHFHCFYRTLKENQVAHSDMNVVFSKQDNVAVFECSPEIQVLVQPNEIADMGYKVSAHTSKKTTKVVVDKKGRR